jgi:hypothetical protein
MEQLKLMCPTDTAHPQPTIPIYFIHSLEYRLLVTLQAIFQNVAQYEQNGEAQP